MSTCNCTICCDVHLAAPELLLAGDYICSNPDHDVSVMATIEISRRLASAAVNKAEH